MPLAKRPWRPTADQVRELRAAHGWTQQDMAGRLFVSLKTVKRWENGDAGGEVRMTSKWALRQFKYWAWRAGWQLD